jgi:pimeloyl-ACP methyl ester carboxylesterase
MGRMPVLMVHGAGGGAWEWTLWRRVFAAAGHPVVAPELTPVSDGLAATGLADYSRQVRAALSAMPAPRIAIGASLGGLLAWMNADLVDTLVLVNPMPAAPWHARLPVRSTPYPPIVPWARTASLEGTRRSLFDADEATCLAAFRRWRDESGRVMNEACEGVAVPAVVGRVVMVISENDEDIPSAVSSAIALALSAATIAVPAASHVGPLLGRQAARTAAKTVAALNGLQASV